MTEYFNQTSKDWRISQCCQFYNPKLVKQYNFGTTTKTYALREGGREKIQSKALENCDKLYRIITEYFAKQPKNLRSFRISTTAFPCYTLEFTQPWYDEIRDELKARLASAGKAAREHEVRLSVHPGQYTVLASPREEVVRNSIADLEYHALLGQYMNIPAREFTINIHLQGLYGGKHSDGIARFAANYEYLSDYVQQALAVENEDKPNGYDIAHVIELCSKIPTRATLDIHHYACHRMTETEKATNSAGARVNRKVRDVTHIKHTDELFLEAVKTWKNIRPLFHVSHPFPEEDESHWMKPNAHAETLWDEELLSLQFPMLEYADFDIEAKNKEIAVIKAYNYFKEEESFLGETLSFKRL